MTDYNSLLDAMQDVDRVIFAADAADEEEEAEENVTMILCDGCDNEYELAATGLKRVPRGDWYCAECKPQKATAKRARRAAAPAAAPAEVEQAAPRRSSRRRN